MVEFARETSAAGGAETEAKAAGSTAQDPESENRAEAFWQSTRSALEGQDVAAAGVGVAEQYRADANWIRDYGRFLVAGGVALGLLVPELAHQMRPYLPHLLVATLVFGLIQADFVQVRKCLNRPMVIGGLLFSLLILSPIFVGLEAKVVLVPFGLPVAIADGMILAALAPPLLSAPAIAFLLGLDTILALVIALAAHLLAPLTIALIAHWLLGPDLDLSIAELMLRLSIIIGTGFLLGVGLRMFKPVAQRGPRGQQVLDGLNVITLACLALAVVDGVAAMALNDPGFMIMAVLCGFLLNPLLQLLGASLFVKSGFQTSLTVGVLAGYRNAGLLIAALGASVNPELVTFLAIVQIPAFVIPMLSSPVLRKVKSIGFDDD